MTTIFESKNFIVTPHPRPEIDRLDGGHIVINPKVKVLDRQALTPDQAKELMRLTILVGEAMKRYYKSLGIELHRINYQLITVIGGPNNMSTSTAVLQMPNIKRQGTQ